jgi:hypothetical protein
MKMFDPRTKHVSPEHARLYAAYELLFTAPGIRIAARTGCHRRWIGSQ